MPYNRLQLPTRNERKLKSEVKCKAEAPGAPVADSNPIRGAVKIEASKSDLLLTVKSFMHIETVRVQRAAVRRGVPGDFRGVMSTNDVVVNINTMNYRVAFHGTRQLIVRHTVGSNERRLQGEILMDLLANPQGPRPAHGQDRQLGDNEDVLATPSRSVKEVLNIFSSDLGKGQEPLGTLRDTHTVKTVLDVTTAKVDGFIRPRLKGGPGAGAWQRGVWRVSKMTVRHPRVQDEPQLARLLADKK